MNGKELLHSLGEIDAGLVEDAARSPERSTAGKWKRWGALAACLALVLGAAFAAGLFRGESAANEKADETSDASPDKAPDADAYAALPGLAVSMEWGGMGFEGVMELDPAELENGNPWRADMALETLPVYRNLAYDPSGAGVPRGLDADEMTARVYAAAEKLGVTVTETENEDSDLYADHFVCRVRGFTAEGVVIDAEADGELTVWFEWGAEHGTALPDEYRFAYDMTDAEAEEATTYLAEHFAALLGFERAKTAISAEYSFDGERSCSCDVYDDAGDDAQRILNYSLSRASFAPNDEGELMLLRMSRALELAEKLGDYPLISLDEAREQLLSGKYLTSVPDDFPAPDAERIARAELVYRGGRSTETILPFYRFYVELPRETGVEQAPGLKTYGAYYVPAVQGRFLATIEYNGAPIGG